MSNTLMINLIRNTAHRLMPAGSKVWLYGSRARGEATSDSDWDLLVLLDKQTVDQNDFATLAYPFVELGWINNEDVSPQIYTLKEWQERKDTPYYDNVEHDKVIVYES